MPDILRRAFLPSLEILLFLFVFYISLFFMPDMINSDGDLGRHITVGNTILDTRTVPTQDIFSHTRYGERVVLHEWLSEIFFASAYRAAGLNGVAWLTALLLATIYFVLAFGLRGLGVSAPLAFVAALAAYLTGMIHHLPRPHLFTLLCFGVFVLLLESSRSQVARRRLWVSSLPLMAGVFLVMILWTNFNGTFVLAFFVLAIYIAGAILEREPRRALLYLALLIISFLASLINPFGIALHQHVFGFMGNRFLVDNTVEYLAPNFHNVSAWLFAAWILFSILLFGRNTTRVSWTHLLLLGAWTMFGLYSARNIANYALVAAVVTAPVAEAWLVSVMPRVRTRLENVERVAPRGGGWVWGIAIVALLIYLQAGGVNFDPRGAGNHFREPTFPVNAVNYLEKNLPQGNMFNEYTWGGYLEYRLFPKARAFIDGDNDFFGEALVREYLDVINARAGWEQILEKYNVRWVLIPPERALARELSRSANWRQIYADASAGVWVKQ